MLSQKRGNQNRLLQVAAAVKPWLVWTGLTRLPVFDGLSCVWKVVFILGLTHVDSAFTKISARPSCGFEAGLHLVASNAITIISVLLYALPKNRSPSVKKRYSSFRRIFSVVLNKNGHTFSSIFIVAPRRSITSSTAQWVKPIKP